MAKKKVAATPAPKKAAKPKAKPKVKVAAKTTTKAKPKAAPKAKAKPKAAPVVEAPPAPVVAPAPVAAVMDPAPVAASPGKRHFEFVDGASSKFWEIAIDGADVTTWWGKIGTGGQTKTKNFGTPDKAQNEYDKLLREKTGKGYVEK